MSKERCAFFNFCSVWWICFRVEYKIVFCILYSVFACIPYQLVMLNFLLTSMILLSICWNFIILLDMYSYYLRSIQYLYKHFLYCRKAVFTYLLDWMQKLAILKWGHSSHSCSKPNHPSTLMQYYIMYLDCLQTVVVFCTHVSILFRDDFCSRLFEFYLRFYWPLHFARFSDEHTYGINEHQLYSHFFTLISFISPSLHITYTYSSILPFSFSFFLTYFLNYYLSLFLPFIFHYFLGALEYKKDQPEGSWTIHSSHQLTTQIWEMGH